MCKRITVLHCTKEEIKTSKSNLDKVWNKENSVIQSIPGTRKSHHFKKVEPYIIGCQTMSDDASDYAEFSFLSGKIALPAVVDKEVVKPATTAYRQGEWVKVMYDNQQHVGIVVNVNTTQHLIQVKCLIPKEGDWWKLEADNDAVWYREIEMVRKCDKEPRMNRRGELYQL